MPQPGIGGVLDTPHTNVGDATYLQHPPDWDISQELSFQSPTKPRSDLLSQLRSGRGVSLRTPHGRSALADRRNLHTIGNEFTPLLKSATRNNARRIGKENGAAAVAALVPPTPGLLDRIDEDLTALPAMDTSAFSASRYESYLDHTLPQVDTSSTMSTPLAIPQRRNMGGQGPLQDGKQLSLREQENVIDRIEKENFGLKLKIHFLEDALRKASPDYSEAALKENTELKVDKVTMQAELFKYKKMVTSAEKDVESYRRQMVEFQERAKRRYVDEAARAELEKLRQNLERKDASIEELQRRVERGNVDQDRADGLRDQIGDLEADVREKDRLLGEREDEADELKERLHAAEDAAREARRNMMDMADTAARTSQHRIAELEAKLAGSEETARASQRRALELEQKVGGLDADAKDARRKVLELEERLAANDELEDARDAMEELERNNQRLEDHVADMREKLQQALGSREQAEKDLEELQDEMANKSVAPKGATRQREEKIQRLQKELDRAGLEFEALENEHAAAMQENDDLRARIKESRREQDAVERQRRALALELEDLRTDIGRSDEEKNRLKTRNDTLATQAYSLGQDIARLEGTVRQLEDNLSRERGHALEMEKHVRDQAQTEIDGLKDEVSTLHAELGEKDKLYDNDSEKWETDRLALESARQRAEEGAAGLQRTIDRLREFEGKLTSKEAKLQEAMQSESRRHQDEEALLSRRIEELQHSLESRQSLVTELRNEMSGLRDHVRQKDLDLQAQVGKAEALEDEVEVLQSALDEEMEQAHKECDKLRTQLELLHRDAPTSPNKSGLRTAEATNQLGKQLSDVTDQLVRANREKQTLQDKLAAVHLEVHTLTSSLAENRAAREELEHQIRRSKQYEEHALRFDQERIELRTSKTRLDNEVRRLKEENRALMDQRAALEQNLEDEMARSAKEAERLLSEKTQLQSRMQQQSGSSESQDLASARRTMRELELRAEAAESQLAVALAVAVASQGNPPAALGDGSSELSVMRHDLRSARTKELGYLQREASQREAVRALKRQLADLERQTYNAEISRLAALPASSPLGSSSYKGEISELREQLCSAHHGISELKSKLRDAERKASSSGRDLQRQLDELQDQKLELEQSLEDARRDAEDVADLHANIQRKLKHKLEKLERERERAAGSTSASMSRGDSRDLAGRLRKAQAESGDLEHDICEQQAIIDDLASSEASVRRQLERTRNERAAYRITAEKLQRDVKTLRAAAIEAMPPAPIAPALVGAKPKATVVGAGAKPQDKVHHDDDKVNAGPDACRERHVKELRGMIVQMEWMQARWEREAMMRADAAYSKKFLQLQLDVATACNNAQLRELEHIRHDVLGDPTPLPPSMTALQRQQQCQSHGAMSKFRSALAVVKFVVRTRVAASKWARHEETRKKIARCVADMKKQRKPNGSQARLLANY